MMGANCLGMTIDDSKQIYNNVLLLLDMSLEDFQLIIVNKYDL